MFWIQILNACIYTFKFFIIKRDFFIIQKIINHPYRR